MEDSVGRRQFYEINAVRAFSTDFQMGENRRENAREKWLIFDETFLVFNIETIANIEIRDRFLISFIRWKSKENLFKNFKHSLWTSTCNF